VIDSFSTPRAGALMSSRRASRGRALALAAAAVALAAWAIAYPPVADLAGQTYRVDLFARAGPLLWDNGWYGGHYLPAYSLLSPPLGALVGLRVLGVACVFASVVLFGTLVAPRPRGGPATVAFALGSCADVWIGRITYALGVTLALAAVLALVRGRRWTAVALSLLCAAASPVAGLFLALAALAHLLAERRVSAFALLGAPAVGTVLLLGLLFGEGGQEPFPATSFAAALAAGLGVLVLLPHRERALRSGAMLYVGAVILSRLIASPMGSNVARLAVLLAAPLLLLAGLPRARVRALGGVAAVSLLIVWTAWGPVREVLKVRRDPSTTADYYRPLSAFLGSRPGPPARVEVPFTRSHWEADFLARRFVLARGWEGQLDRQRNALFFDGRLSAVTYRAWLYGLAVRYVAVPDVPLGPAGRPEAQLIASQPAFLRPVWRGRHWRVYEVLGVPGMVSGSASVGALGRQSFTLLARAPGDVAVRVRYSPYWTVTAGSACVTRAADDFTRVRISRAGTVRVAARLDPLRVVLGAPGC